MEPFLRFAASNAVTATLLAVFVAIVTRCCRRPTVRHALWLLVLLKLIAPPLLPLPVAWPRSEQAETPLVETPPSRLDPSPSELKEPIALPNDPEEAVEVASTDPPADSFAVADYGMPLLITTWLGGSFIWWSLALLRLRKFHRLLRQATPAAADVQSQAQRLAELLRLRRCPPVVFVAAPLSPLLWALGFAPRLLIPRKLWQRLDAEQRDTLLAHELAHLRRGDHWIRRLEFIALGLYWWHPVVWWARRRQQEAEEECCDAVVVSMLPDAASAYASALVETVSFLSQTRAAALVGVSGAGQVPLLKRRLTMILTENRLRRPSRAAFWLILGLGALLLPLAPGARTETSKESERGKEPEQTKPEDSKNRAVEAGIQWLADNKICLSCHMPQTVYPHDLHGESAIWHRQAVHLMDQYTRLLHETDRRVPIAEGNRGDEIEKLQDEIELLRLQVRLKETRLRSAQKAASLARKSLDTRKEMLQRHPGTISREEVEKSSGEAETLAAEAEIKEVELQEATLRLKQSERRLARLQRPTAKTDGERRTEQEKRMRELEQKVESLLKEIRDMRRERQPEKPRPPGQSSTKPTEDRLWKEVGLRLRSVGSDALKKSGIVQFRGGMTVESVRPNSPAERSDLQKGDIVVGLDRYEVLSNEDVQYVVNQTEAAGSQPLKFYVLRNNRLQDGKFEFGE